ncbi:MAG: M1 family metallopeptidase [Chitinophagaceae bacterium]|nr:M1 family metallopeptidase [Chitinophagaceae bacterium]
MIRILLLVLIATSRLTANSQHWQQEVNYTIEVALNDVSHSLRGFEKIEYINNSPDTLRFIWFHIWPNAYKNDQTAFSDQLLENGNTRFYFSDKDQKGYINRLDFKVNGATAETEDHPEHIDILKLILPTPLAPGARTEITTPFHVQLPFNFSRGGHDGQSYQVTQWYPKPAVYDNKGWHPMPYLDQGEFYSDFGSFDVSITVPENYVVAATGELQNASEKEWLETRRDFSWEPVKQKIKTKGGSIKTVTQSFPNSATDIKILRYKQDKVHDFAWFADKRFIVNHDTCQLASGKVVDVYSFYTPGEVLMWRKSVDHGKRALQHYSNLVGDYPYSTLSIVQGPKSFEGGMEYPTVTVISPLDTESELDNTIAHEIGHNWFQGALASDERTHPWMDEGINSYYEEKYEVARNPKHNQRFEQAVLESLIAEKKDQPIETSAEQFNVVNYLLIGYYKTTQWVKWMESYLGTSVFNQAMQEYYRRWQFKHPQPADLQKVMEDVSGKDLDSAFSVLSMKGNLPGPPRKGVAVWTPFNGSPMKNAMKQTQVAILPAIGLNSYDKLMIGAAITNLRLPFNRLQFFLAPMYATGSKRFVGIGFVNQSFFPDGLFRKIDLGVLGSKFTADRFIDDSGNKIFLGFQKLVPSLRLTFREKDPRSTLKHFIQFKTFFISEDRLRFFRDTVIIGIDTTITDRYRTTSVNRTLNQLKLVVENARALYPYRAEMKVEQGKDFVRTAFTGNYFFNYPKGGGLDARLFAGKFFYTSSKTFSKQFATDRYHLNMTGPNGYEDYTYSDYFVGRNEFEGAASQQIMVRDGAFKVRTDLLADKVGRTDDWLIALNFSSTVPNGLNPLSLLPVKIPLKIFVDVGTYAEPWRKNATEDRFLFDAGIHLPLLKETVNIYIPLLYSRVFRDYILSTLSKKNRLLKTISFSIDISNFSFRKINRHIDL